MSGLSDVVSGVVRLRFGAPNTSPTPYLRDLGTTLVIVDEVHNLHTDNPAGAQAASALKVLSERLDATFLATQET